MFPTTRLPPIRRGIPSHSTQTLADALEYLWHLYLPSVRGCRRRRPSSNQLPSADKDTVDHSVAHGHLDPFERNYTIKWLTALISHIQTRQTASESDDISETLVQQAASLLALCSGTSAAGTFHRNFVFTSSHVHDPSYSIAVRIKDIPLNNHDYASVGAQTWGGACVLSESIVDEPWKFGICSAPQTSTSTLLGQDTNISVAASYFKFPTPELPVKTIHQRYPLRILELGAGTGLVSLTVGKLLQKLASAHHSPTTLPAASNISFPLVSLPVSTTLVATDHYPPVLENLAYNIQANFTSPNPSDSVSITSHFLDWASFSSTYAATSPNSSATPPKPFNEPFDLIFGADIVYELEHASWIKSCLSVLLQKPTTPSEPTDLINGDDGQTNPAFHLIIPLRPTHVNESRTVELIFPPSDGFNSEVLAGYGDSVPVGNVHGSGDFAILELCILSKEVIVCETEERATTSKSEDDGVVYLYYKIGWSVPRQKLI